MNSNEFTYRQARAGLSGDVSEWHWTDYLGILIDRIWIVIAVLVLVTAGGVLKVHREVPMYRSSARILIEESMPKVLNLDELLSAGTRNIEYFNTHVLALSSRTMVTAAMKAKGLEANPLFVSQSLDEAGKVVAALEYVRIEPVPKSRLIDIAVVHPDPKLASEFANGLAEQYIAVNLSRRMDTSLEAFGWMKQLADEYRVKIEQGQLAIHEYRKDAKSVSLEEGQDTVVSKLKAISGELTAAESQFAVVEAEWAKVEAVLKAKQPLALLTSIGQEEAVRSAHAELQRKQSEVALLKTRYQDKHPDMIKARNEEQELEALHDKACQEAARRAESRYKLAKERVQTLRESLAQQEQAAMELNRKLVKYNELKRAVESDRQIYDAFVARMKEMKIAGDIKASNIRLVDSAEPSAVPFQPVWSRAIALSVLLGLALGVGLSLGSYFLDDRIRRVEDVERALACRVLSVIPPVDSRLPSDRSRIAERDRQTPSSEAFRSMRAGMALQPEWPKARRLLITSTTSGEGKSLVASNLAIVLAQDGMKTVLIDGDMRRPTAHRMFENVAKEGLSDLLKGSCTLEQALSPTPVENLFVIAAGATPKNPSELLGSAEMKGLMAVLGERFDRIVVDCPPVFGVSDPIAVLPVMDGVVFVVHYGKVGRRAAARAVGKVREGSAALMGVVLNNVSLKLSSGYYYYYRYHGYEYEKARKHQSHGA